MGGHSTHSCQIANMNVSLCLTFRCRTVTISGHVLVSSWLCENKAYNTSKLRMRNDGIQILFEVLSLISHVLNQNCKPWKLYVPLEFHSSKGEKRFCVNLSNFRII